MKVLLSHSAGNQNVRAMLDALARAGLLARFATTVAADEHSAVLRLMPAGVRRDWLRRRFDLPRDKILQHRWRELARVICGAAGWQSALRHEQGFASLDAVIQDFDRFVARSLPSVQRREPLGAVYAYEDGALDTFRAARALGIKRVYDLPIAYWELGHRLQREEGERLPAWAATLGGGLVDSPAKLARKTQELELADLVAVASTFVRDSLPASAAHKAVVMSPFGSPPRWTGEWSQAALDAGRPMRVLFAGSMGQRKGLGDLFAAMKLLAGENIELVVLGSPMESMDFYKGQYAGFTHEKSRPHSEVLALMRSCDVFCLPSIVEGRALVMQEAMSQGLPVVITPNTGGADLVIEGRTGFLVPIRSPEKIAERLAWLNQHRTELVGMKEQAASHAAGYSWTAYGDAVVDAIRQLESAPAGS
jgi:glycosyltransferase involved in cell wall biosynthesis